MSDINCQVQKGQGQPYYFYNFQTRTAIVALTGDLINAIGPAIFPVATRVALIDFQADVGLFSLSFASSIINQVAGDTAGLFVALDSGPQISLDGGVNFLLNHLTRQNSTAAIRNANSKTTAVQMGQNTAYLLNSGQKLAIYASSANDVGNEFSATLTAAWIPYIPGGR